MSKFLGVTFADQNVQPSDDAAVRRAALSDGFLYGCELSYAGSTLTMASGQILACGRQFKHPTSDNWAVVDATSGYARLLLTIDLSRSSTEDTFDQVVDSIEYATSIDGFPELEQENINSSGLRYQMVACVVSLGTGGITGIVKEAGYSRAKPPLVKLYVNASPNSNFAGTPAPIAIPGASDCDYYMVEFVGTDPSILIRRGVQYTATRVNLNTTASNNPIVQIYERDILIDNEGMLTAGDGKRSTYTSSNPKFTALTADTIDNSVLKINIIYGIQGAFV